MTGSGPGASEGDTPSSGIGDSSFAGGAFSAFGDAFEAEGFAATMGRALDRSIGFVSATVVEPVLNLAGKVFGTLEASIAQYSGDFLGAVAKVVTQPIDALLPGTPMDDLVSEFGTNAAKAVMDFGYDLAQDSSRGWIPDNPLSGPLARSAEDLRPFGWTGIWDNNGRDSSLKNVVSNPNFANQDPFRSPKTTARGHSTSGGAKRKRTTTFYGTRQYGMSSKSGAGRQMVIYK